jgi:hypothetical protein
MASRLSPLLLLLLSPPLCRGLDNGLGRLPGLGWNSDYCTNCSDSSASSSWAVGATAGPNSQNEKFVRHIADWFHTHKYPMASDRSSMKTMQQLGFHYVNMCVVGMACLPRCTVLPLNLCSVQCAVCSAVCVC